MLTEVHVSSFKCFDVLDLQLRPLTLLSGINGGGKSSIIHSLVLLAQTLTEREWGRSLLLDGSELALGNATDVMNQESARRALSLGVATADERVRWTFAVGDKRALSLELEGVEIDGRPILLNEPVRWLMPAGLGDTSSSIRALRGLSWITAERAGPREILPLRDAEGHRHVGARGELAAGLLHWREFDDVRPELCLSDHPPTLFHQVRARMQEFFRGCDLRVDPIEGASAVTLRLRTDKRSDFRRPQNVGFGLTQIFPIIVGSLGAQPGDVFVVENPEVHLHPHAQQQMGTLLSRVAATGVQVLVETHSDHVLNGMRIAVKSGIISPSGVAVHFFGNGSGAPRPLSPNVDADGRLDIWPEGFFDQFDIALSALL